MLPKALVDLIDNLSMLPGVGYRTAERYAYYIFRHDKSIAHKLSASLEGIHQKIKFCPVTFALIDSSDTTSPLYNSPSRDRTTVLVVAEPFDIMAIENTASYKGTYHVLGGLISPLDGIGPEQLHISELIKRVDEDHVKEIIIATNASVEGETTAMFIQKQLADSEVELTRLARGLPIGVDLEYADQITLTRALEGRTAL